jgi:dTDP-4-dehydrorhamnose 3,5-epimerase-like enzyme
LSENNLFDIEKIEPADPNDTRGPTFGWKHSDNREIVVIVRKKGSILGGHFHKGKDPSKDPEKFLIAKGKLRSTFVNKYGSSKTTILRQGDIFTIYPYVNHTFEVLSDAVIIEYRITHYNKDDPDTFPEKELFN